MKIKNTMISLLGLTAATALVYAAGTAPVITTQPQSQMVKEGESVTFSVIAESNTGFPEGENFTTPISGSVRWHTNGGSCRRKNTTASALMRKNAKRPKRSAAPSAKRAVRTGTGSRTAKATARPIRRPSTRRRSDWI